MNEITAMLWPDADITMIIAILYAVTSFANEVL